MSKKLLELCLVLLLAGCQTPAPAPLPPAPACPEATEPPEVQQLKALLAKLDELHKTLTLAQGRSGAEQVQAAAQLDALAADARAEPLQPLAVLLAARLAEQRRQQDGLDKLTTQLKEAQRRNEQLHEKLEALKAIEQTLPPKPGRGS